LAQGSSNHVSSSQRQFHCTCGSNFQMTCVCDKSQQPCVCCDREPPLKPVPDDGTMPEPPTVPVSEIVAIATDPRARQANLYMLDSLVIGTPLGKVDFSQNDVVALEAETRRAFDEGYCDFCRQIVTGEDFSKVSGDHVIVALTPKIVSCWARSVSYDLLEFADEDRQVSRPQFVSAFPAALAPADVENPTSLRFRVLAFPSNKTILSVGVALWPGFKVYFGRGFGEEEGSWGLQWRAEDGNPCKPEACSLRLSRGDLVSITCDTWRGSSTIFVNGEEAGNFSLPCEQAFILGVTLSVGCSLRIESSKAILASCM